MFFIVPVLLHTIVHVLLDTIVPVLLDTIVHVLLDTIVPCLLDTIVFVLLDTIVPVLLDTIVSVLLDMGDMSIFKKSPQKWPKTHTQKLFFSIFE